MVLSGLCLAQDSQDSLRAAEHLIERYLDLGRRGATAPRDWRRAARTFSEIADLEPNRAHWRSRAAYCDANALIEERHFETAIPLYVKCRQIDPSWAPCTLGLGIAWTEMRMLWQAKSILMEGLRLEPRLAYLHRALGIVHREMGRFAEAEQDFKKALQLRPHSDRALQPVTTSTIN